MAIEAIGNELSTTTSELAQSRLGQEDFIKLFLTELTFQDPLEPINNREVFWPRWRSSPTLSRPASPMKTPITWCR